MKLSCIHCGLEFSITADQLGGRGRCPHCRGEIQLPRAEEDQAGQHHPLQRPLAWIENSISALGSFVFHLIVIICAALINWDGPGFGGEGEEVLIGTMSSEKLGDAMEEKLTTTDEVEKERKSEILEDPLDEIQPPSATATDTTSLEMLDVSIRPSGGGGAAFNFDAVAGGGAMGGNGDWDGMLKTLQRNGLDVVLAFDSTGSMSGEINEVKSKIERIGGTLIKLVPKAQISVCTYRDDGDSYVVKGLPLTNDMQQIKTYLDGISAGGGGDEPEAVHEGLRWSIANNQFRGRARKVILLFGDAPPHQQFKKTCLELASDFKTQQGGVVSTVTCRRGDRLEDFVDIAQYGGGEAFLTVDEEQIMTQLMVLVFGSQYRGKVLEAFKLMEK